MRRLHRNPRHHARCKRLLDVVSEVMLTGWGGSLRIRMLLGGAEKISPVSSVMTAIALIPSSGTMPVGERW